MVKVLFDDEEFTRWLKQASHTLQEALNTAQAVIEAIREAREHYG